jgi:hypothetical protein
MLPAAHVTPGVVVAYASAVPGMLDGNALEALLGRFDPSTEVAQRVWAEGAEVLRAAGISYVSEKEDLQRRADILQIRPVANRERGGGSTCRARPGQPAMSRRTTSTAKSCYWVACTVSPRRANELARKLVNRHAAARRAPGSMTRESFLASLQETDKHTKPGA